MGLFLDYEKFLDKEFFYTKEELTTHFNLLESKFIIDSIYIKNEKRFLTYKNLDLIIISEDSKTQVSKKLIHDFLQDEGMYRFLLFIFNNQIASFSLKYIISIDKIETISLTKRELICALDKMSDELNSKEQMRYAFMKNYWTPSFCHQFYSAKKHIIALDDKVLKIPISNLLELLMTNTQEFEKNLKKEEIYGYQKEILFAALVDFVEKNNLLDSYAFPDNIIKRYEKLKNYLFLDFKNLYQKIKSNKQDKTKEFNRMKSFLDINIEPYYSNLEKAIYYYLKLCESFSFNSNIYLSSNQDTPNELLFIPNAVNDFFKCYFLFLDDLKIEYSLIKNYVGYFNKPSTYLIFSTQEYTVKVSVTKDDNNNLTLCMTSSDSSKLIRQKFDEIRVRVYEEMMEKAHHKFMFQKALVEYENLVKYKNNSVYDKLYILISELTNHYIRGIDDIARLKILFTHLFSKQDNITFSILAKKNLETNYLSYIAIITITDDNNCIIIDKTNKKTLRSINISELKSLLQDKSYYKL